MGEKLREKLFWSCGLTLISGRMVLKSSGEQNLNISKVLSEHTL